MTLSPHWEILADLEFSKSFIAWASKSFGMPILEEFIHATRMPELPTVTSIIPLTSRQQPRSLNQSPRIMCKATKVCGVICSEP